MIRLQDEGKKPTDKGFIPNAGTSQTGKVKIRIKSPNRNFNNEYNIDLASSTKDGDKLYSTVIIAYCDLNRVEQFEDGRSSRLYINYYIYNSITNDYLGKSKFWRVNIDTMMLGEDLNKPDGCPPRN
ncbi:hypothetical protein [Xenorhabdus stockiae]|uniref:hypothetical protein n=1 Tax=Xenorhabdus stockiae TaxID=351614 RepID=UPI00406492B2